MNQEKGDYMNSTHSSIASTRRLTMVVVISMVVAVGALVVASVAFWLAPSDSNDGNEIVLVDDGGRPRVRLAATSNGGAVELLDERGRARIALRQAGEESSISMHRKEQADEGSDYAMRFLVDEEKRLNLLDMRDPATGAAVKLSASDGGALTLGDNSGEAKLFASKLGASLHLRLGDRNLGVDVGETANINLVGVPFMLNGRRISLPTSDR